MLTWKELRILVPRPGAKVPPSRGATATAEDGSELEAYVYGSPLRPPMVFVLEVQPPEGERTEPRFPRLEEVQSAIDLLTPHGSAFALGFLASSSRDAQVPIEPEARTFVQCAQVTFTGGEAAAGIGAAPNGGGRHG